MSAALMQRERLEAVGKLGACRMGLGPSGK